MSKLLVYGRRALVGTCIAFTAHQNLARPWLLAESSMEPTLTQGQIVLTTSLHQRLRRGDIIIFKSPSNPDERLCKRIIGLPGDVVHYSQNNVVMPPGHVWVEGDCVSPHCSSFDSRSFGPVPIGLLQGLVYCRLYPFAGKSSLQLPSLQQRIKPVGL